MTHKGVSHSVSRSFVALVLLWATPIRDAWRRTKITKEEIGTRKVACQTDPDDEPEQVEDIDRCLFPDALFPQFLEVRENPGGKEGENKEHHPVKC